MHAVALATELGMRKVIVPHAADVFSAWGMLMSDLRRDYFVTRLLTLKEENAPLVDELLSEVTDNALKQFEEEGVSRDRVRFLRYGKFRYENQENSVEVLLPDGSIEGASIAEISEAFHTQYEREYTYRLDAPIEFVGTHVVAFAEVGKLEPARLPVTGRKVEDALKGTREVDYALEGIHEAAIYDGALLEPGMRLEGPAIIEMPSHTIVVHPGNKVHEDEFGNVHIDLGKDGE